MSKKNHTIEKCRCDQCNMYSYELSEDDDSICHCCAERPIDFFG